MVTQLRSLGVVKILELCLTFCLVAKFRLVLDILFVDKVRLVLDILFGDKSLDLSWTFCLVTKV